MYNAATGGMYGAASMGYQAFVLTGQYACEPFLMLKRQAERYLEFRTTLRELHTEDDPRMAIEQIQEIYSALSDTPMSAIEDDRVYALASSRKPAFQEWIDNIHMGWMIEMTHCSLAIKPLEEPGFPDGDWLAFGRQSPMFRAVNAQRTIATVIDNEKDYPMFGEMPFRISHSPLAKVTGRELKDAIESTNELCRNQLCDIVSSNCYTASINILVCLYDNVNARDCPTEESIEDRDNVLFALKGYIAGLMVDHRGIGIVNNQHIMNALKRIRAHRPDIEPRLRPVAHP